MRNVVIGIAVFVGLLIMGFIAWFTGGSPLAFLAGILLLGFAGVLLAGTTSVVTLPGLVRNIIIVATACCLLIIFIAAGSHWWSVRKQEQAVAALEEVKNTPAPSQAVAQIEDPNNCKMPCSRIIYGEFDLKFPSVKTEVDAPLKEGKRHTFVFDADGKFENDAEQELWKEIRGGEYNFAAPGHSGLPIGIVRLSQ